MGRRWLMNSDGRPALPDPNLLYIYNSKRATRRLREKLQRARDEMLAEWEEEQRAKAAAGPPPEPCPHCGCPTPGHARVATEADEPLAEVST